jgi:hypothetical protein
VELVNPVVHWTDTHVYDATPSKASLKRWMQDESGLISSESLAG